jgi:hypothetical protein
VTGESSPVTPKDRSRFLFRFDEAIHAVRKAHPNRKRGSRQVSLGKEVEM